MDNDQISMTFKFFFDMENGETADDALERLLCILDGLGIQYIGLGLPNVITD